MIDKVEVQPEKNSIHPLAAGITGIVIGAAAAIALADEPTRDKVTKKAKHLSSQLQKWGSHKLESMKDTKASTQRLVHDKEDPIVDEIKRGEL